MHGGGSCPAAAHFYIMVGFTQILSIEGCQTPLLLITLWSACGLSFPSQRRQVSVTSWMQMEIKYKIRKKALLIGIQLSTCTNTRSWAELDVFGLMVWADLQMLLQAAWPWLTARILFKYSWWVICPCTFCCVVHITSSIYDHHRIREFVVLGQHTVVVPVVILNSCTSSQVGKDHVQKTVWGCLGSIWSSAHYLAYRPDVNTTDSLDDWYDY